MELLHSNAAAAVLHELLPEKSPTQWGVWLQNNRNPQRRTPYRVPFERLVGGVFYRAEDLTAYAEWEKARQLGTLKLTGRAAEVMRAFGIGERGGATTGRKFNVTAINPQVEEGTGLPFVQIITDDPLMVYRCDLDEAKRLARELLEAINVCERAVE